MQVTIGTAPCSWGVWWADGTPTGTPWEILRAQAAEGGNRALEMGPDGYLPTDVGQLREELAKRGLSICAGTACYEFAGMRSFAEVRDRVDALCRRLAAFDAKYLVTMDGSNMGYYGEFKQGLTADDWNRYYAMFGEMGRFTREQYGIETVFHQHNKTLIETEAELVRILEDSQLKLCFDTGHYAAVNGGWQQGDQSAIDFMRKYAAEIPYLHFKNVNGQVRRMILEEHLAPGDPKGQDVMCDLPDGIIDYVQFRDLLRALDFQGIGIIEQDVPNCTTAEAYEKAKKNLRYLQGIGLIA